MTKRMIEHDSGFIRFGEFETSEERAYREAYDILVKFKNDPESIGPIHTQILLHALTIIALGPPTGSTYGSNEYNES